jgi:selenocysteine-specific elongation factor
MKGFGTVITGTLASGKVNVGDNIMIFPSRITSKVRGIQVHGNSVDTVTAGSRTAINFQGLDRETIDRGDILSTPETLHPSYMADAELLFLSSNAKPAKARTRVRFHSGTSEVFGYMVLLDRPELTPGDTACVQLRLETPVCLMKGDRFVIRSYSPVKTIGGGQILNPVARKHKLSDTQAIKGMTCLMEDDHEMILSYFAEQGKFTGVSFADLRIMTSIPDKKLGTTLQKMLANRRLVQTDKEQRIYIHGTLFDSIAKEAIERLATYHKDNPLKEGMPSQELKSKFRAFNDKDSKLFPLVIARLTKEDKVIQDKGSIRLSHHEVELQVDEQEIRGKILKTYQGSGLTPPFFRTICQDLEVNQKVARDVLQMLIDEKHIVKTKDDLYFDAKAIRDIEAELVTFLQTSGEITTPQFKDMAGISRKYIIPLIEYFDTINLTIRVGDTRQLRKKS